MNINPSTKASSNAVNSLLGRKPKVEKLVPHQSKIRETVYLYNQTAAKLMELSDTFGMRSTGKKAVSNAQIIQAIFAKQLESRNIEELKAEVLAYLGF